MGDVPAASQTGAVLFELEELIGVDARAFAALLDLAGAEGAAGDGVVEERVLGGVRSGLHTCGGRVRYSIGLGGGEGRGQRGGYACFCKRGMRGWRRKKRRGRDMGGRDVHCMLRGQAGGYNRKGGKGGSVGVEFRSGNVLANLQWALTDSTENKGESRCQ